MTSEYQQLEFDAHEEFGNVAPSNDELATFLERRITITNLIDPVSISIAALAVSTAALMLQGWQTYQAGVPKCPECGRPAKKKNADGNYECIKGHEW